MLQINHYTECCYTKCHGARHKIRRYDIQHNDTQHKGLICDTQHKGLSITTLCHYAECHHAEYRVLFFCYAECHYAKCRCAECRGVQDITLLTLVGFGILKRHLMKRLSPAKFDTSIS